MKGYEVEDTKCNLDVPYPLKIYAVSLYNLTTGNVFLPLDRSKKGTNDLLPAVALTAS